MKLRKLMLTLIMGSIFCIYAGYGQVKSVRYQLRYNTTSCRYDAYLHFNTYPILPSNPLIIVGPNDTVFSMATTPIDRTQFNAQLSIVVPSTTNVTIAQSFMPLTNNQTYTSTLPSPWTIGSTVVNPNNGMKYISITPTLSPPCHFNNISNRDSVRIFSISVSSLAQCGQTARFFINGVDPGSNVAGMSGGDFSNGYTIGGLEEQYVNNKAQIFPPNPLATVTTTCTNGLEIDLSATTSSCQSPLTYEWTGPNGFTATTQDVSIPNATSAANGTYNVAVTDALGCRGSQSVVATAQPTAGPNSTSCANGIATLTGTAPSTGTWSSAPTNPPGATVGATFGGVADVSFSGTAAGTYSFLYTSGPCSDITQITVASPDGGPDPFPVSCFSSGNATLSGTGNGVWSLDIQSSGTAIIQNPNSGSTSATNFSGPGTYVINWTVNGCVDQVLVTVSDNCNCAIANNNIAPLGATNFCGNSGSFVLDAQTGTPIGGTYQWQSSLNGGAFGAAPGVNTSEDYSSAGLANGIHRLRRIYTITGGAPCSDTSNVILLNVNQIPPVPTNLAGVPNPVCLPNPVNLSVTSVPGIIYNWSASSPTAGLAVSSTNLNTMTPTAAGTYTISVTASANGCTSFAAITLVTAGATPYTPTQSDVTSVNPSACATATGAISIAGFTPNTAFTVTYNKNGTAQTVNVLSNAAGIINIPNLTSGVYNNFVIRNSASCTSGNSTVSVTLSDPSAPAAPANLTAVPNPACLGTTVNLNVTNTPGAVYAWTVSPTGAVLGSAGPGSTNTLSGSLSGSYSVNVTQTIGGCTSAPASVSIMFNPSPATPTPTTVVGTNPSACGGTNGFITLSGYMPNTSYTVTYTVGGGNQTLTALTNASGSFVIPNLPSGSYSNFRITSFSGCASGVFAGPILLSDPNSPAAPSNLTAVPNPSCLGTVVNLSVTNNPAAVYTWTANSVNAGIGVSTTNTNAMTALATGTYTVSVTQNVSGCVSPPATVTLNVQGVPSTPSSTSVTGISPVSCGGSNGSIALAGLLNLTTYTINYSKNGSPTSALLTTNASGVATILNLTAGTYTNFSIQNSAGCTSGVFPGPISLTDPGSPAAPTNITANPNPICSGGTVNLSVSNNAGATYTWSSTNPFAFLGSSTTNMNTMSPTTVSTSTIVVNVTQTIGGCTSPPTSITITVNSAPTLSPANFTPVNPTVCGGTDGSIRIDLVTPNETFTLDYIQDGVAKVASITTNALGIATLSNLSAGNYTGFRARNAAGCPSNTINGSFNLNDPNSPTAPTGITAVPNPVCLGSSVALSTTGTGTINWSASSAAAGLAASTSTSNSMLATSAGTYTITASRTVAGCTSPATTVTVTVGDIPVLPSAITSANPTCANTDGSLLISGYAPTQSYTINYAYNGTPRNATIVANGNGVLTISNLDGGSYTNFSVANGQGCASGVNAGPIVLFSPGLPAAPTGFTSTPNFVCLRSVVNLQVTSSNGGSSSGVFYTWLPSSPNAGLGSSMTNANTLTPLAVGIFTISVTQTVNGCVSPPASIDVEVRGDCYNPDFDVTWVGISTDGDVKTNDLQLTSTYSPAVALPGNPSSCLPVVASDGSYTFNCLTPGQYRYNVAACLAPSSCENVVLQITVLDFIPNNPPVANHDYLRTKANTPITVNALANDRCESYPNCSLDNMSILVPPARGTFNMVSGTYTPNNNFVGLDSFRYRICQLPSVSPTNCSEAWVYLHIIGAANTNITNGMDDFAQTPFNTTLTVSAANGLKANDRDPEGNTQSITPITQTIVGKGDVTINADGSYVFIPTTGYSGPLAIPYEVCDAATPRACDNATLHLLVERFNAVGSLGNFVWNDTNGNGLQDASEPGVSAVKVILFDDNDLQIAVTTTSSTGAYQFDNVAAGRYYLKFIPPSTYSFTIHSQGSDRTKDSDVTNQFGVGTTSYITILPGQIDLGQDAGLYICSKVGGYVWYDTNKNDIRDVFENGLNAIIVKIWRRVGSIWVIYSTKETDKNPLSNSDDGYFEFCVRPGEYYVSVEIPAIQLVPALPNKGSDRTKDSDITNTFGFGSTRSFTVLSGENKLDIGAGYYPMATTGNLVWNDLNLNGIQDGGEPPVANVNVRVYDAGSHEMLGQATTNNSGQYLVDYLQKKDVYLKFDVPAGKTATIPKASTDAKDSDVDHTYGLNTTRKFSLQPGTSYVNIDLGLVFAPLPVNWLYVNAKRIKDVHHVIWATAQEHNTSYYQVERKLNSDLLFVSVSDELPAAGFSSSTSEYRWVDQDVKRSGLYQYRVKQADLDGQVTYTDIVSIKNVGEISSEVYPNPAVKESFVKLNVTDDTKVKVELFDGQGKLVATIEQGKVLEAGEHIFPINLASLPNGVYVVHLSVDDYVKKHKMIKVE
jgi:hypothetical protein